MLTAHLEGQPLLPFCQHVHQCAYTEEPAVRSIVFASESGLLEAVVISSSTSVSQCRRFVQYSLLLQVLTGYPHSQ